MNRGSDRIATCLTIHSPIARRPHEIELWVLHIKMIPVDHHTYAQTKMNQACLHWAVYETSQLPLAHATSEGSDEPAHPHSLARGINTHMQGM